MEQNPAGLWYRASAKNVVIFALMWLGEAFLILKFFKWVIRERTRLFAFGSVGAFWFDNGGAPELAYTLFASVRQSIRRRWSALRETTAARFSLDDQEKQI